MLVFKESFEERTQPNTDDKGEKLTLALIRDWQEKADDFMKAVGKSATTGKPIDYKGSASDRKKAKKAVANSPPDVQKKLAAIKKKKEAEEEEVANYTPSETLNLEPHGIPSSSVKI